MRDLNPGEHYYEIGVAENSNGHNPVKVNRLWLDGKMVGKKIDILPERKERTVFFPARSYKHARNWARKRFHNILFCRKVDVSYRLNKIEHLRLPQETISILIEKGEFEVGADFEIDMPDIALDKK